LTDYLRGELSHAGPTDMNREAELDRPSRVACSDLLGIVVVLLFLWMCHRPRSYLIRCRILHLKCFKKLIKCRLLLLDAREQCLICKLRFFEYLDLFLNCRCFRYVFCVHKSKRATMPNV
jgi:hypothetical protein